MVELEDRDRALLDGEDGEGAALAMRLVVKMAEVARAPRLRDITRAHIDSCLYHGHAGLDFAERLLAGGATASVPATLNVSSLDLLHPDLVHLDDDTRARAKRQMDAYVAMGCRPTWTCAPYQLPDRPAFGEHVAWAESNAIVFANSVLGARTNRYGDFIDICAAITGRVPDHGLHTDEARLATVVVRLEGLTDALLDDELLYPVLGHLLGRRAGSDVWAIDGLPSNTSEDRLKAIGAAAASSGSVALFHAIGVTPEAPTWEAVAAERTREETITLSDLRAARDELSPVGVGAEIGAVSVGTPHASEEQLRRLAALVAETPPRIPFYVNTGRAQLAGIGSIAEDLADAGVTVVTDTCTYITPVLHEITGPVMTDSGKWAWYAPSNLGFDVALGSLEDCVRSAAEGRVVRVRSSLGGLMEARTLVEGSGTGSALVLEEPLSFWGGLDPATGEIVEASHPQRGQTVTGCILVLPSGRGSSSSATVLAESIRLGTGPAGIVLGEPDEIIAIGAIVAAELYGVAIPVVVAPPDEFGSIRSGDRIALP